ncbi:hypothetical protein [Tardiphaga sp. 42S5]|uniref:hypothetical protein n=1 Tax=Tardiphaga sp. 42S5 TaxID=1404799 RepID=UPI002A5A9365|nr:hypothetical protein [Tardiphaga sp. 42S5]WPO39448.1 hypothetical protein SFY93_18005 [Tardiphaga sp. 42S5]
MPNKRLGNATYKAYRLLGLVHLSATGELTNFNDKPDFEQLPFLIDPPMYAFYVISPDIGLPATRPFTYEETISFPKSAKSIRMQDATGFHDVPIAEVVVPDFDAATPIKDGANFCVYGGHGIIPLMVGPCGPDVSGLYERVFGPASFADCENYAKKNKGL